MKWAREMVEGENGQKVVKGRPARGRPNQRAIVGRTYKPIIRKVLFPNSDHRESRASICPSPLESAQNDQRVGNPTGCTDFTCYYILFGSLSPVVNGQLYSVCVCVFLHYKCVTNRI